MFDQPHISSTLQRTKGRAMVALALKGGTTRLVDLHQSGSAKAMLPKTHRAMPEVVFLNTAGGITGGDYLEYTVDVGPGAAVVATTQTAERAYQSIDGVGRVKTQLRVGAGGTLLWVPQEVILFQQSALERETTVEMAADATVLVLESLVLGRAAMGETLHQIHLRDRRSVRRCGRLVMMEQVRLDTSDLMRPGRAMLDGARAVASMTLFAPDAADRLDAIRLKLGELADVRIAASAWDGRISLRAMAADAYPLRCAMAAMIENLTGQLLPRVWQI
jgi:urease accessory protein